jgi:hypothetical protein
MSRPSGNPRRDKARRHLASGWLPLLLTLDLTGLNPTQLDWQVAAGKLAHKVLRGVTVYSLSDVLRLTGAANGPELLDKHFPVANPGRKRKGACRQRFESHSSATKRGEFAARIARVNRHAAKGDRDASKRLSATEWGILNRLLYQAGVYGHLTVCVSITELQRHTGMKAPESIHRALRSLKGADILRMERDGTDGTYIVTLLDPLTGQPFPDDLDHFPSMGTTAHSSWEPAT